MAHVRGSARETCVFVGSACVGCQVLQSGSRAFPLLYLQFSCLHSVELSCLSFSSNNSEKDQSHRFILYQISNFQTIFVTPQKHNGVGRAGFHCSFWRKYKLFLIFCKNIFFPFIDFQIVDVTLIYTKTSNIFFLVVKISMSKPPSTSTLRCTGSLLHCPSKFLERPMA